MSDPNNTDVEETWIEATESFVTEAGDSLGKRFAPQIKALRALARTLDDSERYEPGLAAEYARMHRWLLNKTSAKGGADPEDSGPDLLDMLAANPGVRWTPDA